MSKTRISTTTPLMLIDYVIIQHQLQILVCAPPAFKTNKNTHTHTHTLTAPRPAFAAPRAIAEHPPFCVRRL